MEFAGIISSGLTFSFIFACVAVVIRFHVIVVDAVSRWSRREEWSERHYLATGIYIMFLGAIGDNAWWGHAWDMRTLGIDGWNWWFDNGVYSNIFFRLSLGLWGAFLHLRGAYETDDANYKALMFSIPAVGLGRVIYLVGA